MLWFTFSPTHPTAYNSQGWVRPKQESGTQSRSPTRTVTIWTITCYLDDSHECWGLESPGLGASNMTTRPMITASRLHIVPIQFCSQIITSEFVYLKKKAYFAVSDGKKNLPWCPTWNLLRDKRQKSHKEKYCHDPFSFSENSKCRFFFPCLEMMISLENPFN